MSGPSFTCPEGHTSSAGDYCDVCGAPIDAQAAPGAPPAPPANSLSLDPQGSPPGPEKECPNCHAGNLTTALFCEDCGYDFTTGQLPPPQPGADPPAPVAAAAPADWVAETWVDPDWYAHETSPDAAEPCPPAGPPRIAALHGPSVLVGRASDSRGIHPDIDCGSDSGVSRRHVHLSLDAGHWYAEDLQSTNGTFVSAAGAPLPDPAGAITPGQKVMLGPDDRLFLGAWTRIVVRPATDAERNL